VEKNATLERVAFLRPLLELNGYTVVVQPSPPPKAPLPAATEAPVELAPAPETFTIGVTDVMFNPTNAVFGRLLRTRDARVVTLAYWNQQETVSNDEIPYFENTP
jgi:hypothetical protein